MVPDGFEVAPHHCNSGERIHGAMVCAAAGLALGRNIGMEMAKAGHYDNETIAARLGAPIATISLNTDFVGYAQEGDWVEVHVDVQKVGKSLGFAMPTLSVPVNESRERALFLKS